MPAMREPLYVPDGDRFVPTAHTRGPWDAGAQHGGPVTALMARAIEALPSDVPMRVVRFTAEILRPITLQPLLVSARIERGGRRVALLSAALSDGERELCRASAWLIRVRDQDIETPPPPPLPFARPDGGVELPPESDQLAFHRTGAELRFVRGSFFDVGPSTVWIRLRRPVVGDEAPSPLMRAAAASDFGNGISAAVPWGRYLYINTDLSVYLHRYPAGEWVCLDASTRVEPGGMRVAESELYDEQGRIGRSLQALLVDTLPTSDP